jgi:hypothetical protein
MMTRDHSHKLIAILQRRIEQIELDLKCFLTNPRQGTAAERERKLLAWGGVLAGLRLAITDIDEATRTPSIGAGSAHDGVGWLQ